MPRVFIRSRSVPGLAALLAAVGAVHAAPPSSAYKLVFADEFSGSTLDTVKWNYNYPWGSGHTHNHAAYMDQSQVIVGNGVLNLQAIRQRHPNAQDYWHNDFGWQVMDYTSGAINTQGKFNTTGGYFEARMKMPDLVGTWPAFWMLQNGWPPEIDIMEFPVGSEAQKREFVANYHYTNNGSNASFYRVVSTGTDLSQSFNTFGLEWTTSQLKFYFNGSVVHTVNSPTAIAQAQGMYMILNHGIDGWAATPPASATWPADFLIDYVRVWQIPDAIGTVAFNSTAGTGSWDDNTKWATNAPRHQDQIARFGPNNNAIVNLNWTSSKTLGGLLFETGTTFQLGSTTSSLQMANSTGVASIYVSAATTRPQAILSRIELYNDTRIANYSNQFLVLNGQIVGEKSISKAGPGVLQLNAANTYSGGTTFFGGTNSGDGGIIRLRSGASLGTGTLDMPGTNSASQVLELANNITVHNNLTTGGRSSPVFLRNYSGNNIFAGDITFNRTGGGYAIDAASGTLDIAGDITTSIALNTARDFTLTGAATGTVSGSILDGASTPIALTKSGTGMWTLGNQNNFTGGTTVAEGTLVVAHPLALGSGSVAVNAGLLRLDTNANAARVTSLAINAPGTVELDDGGLVIDHNNASSISVLEDVRGWIADGLIDGASSSLAVGYADAATLNLSTFNGMPLDASAVVIRPAMPGDFDLNNVVDFADLLALARNFGGTDKFWTDGDSDADGVVAFSDLLTVARQFGNASIAQLELTAGFASQWELARSVVPEPAAFAGVVSLAALGLRRRSR